MIEKQSTAATQLQFTLLFLKKTCFFHNEHFDKSVLHQIEFCTHTKKEKI